MALALTWKINSQNISIIASYSEGCGLVHEWHARYYQRKNISHWQRKPLINYFPDKQFIIFDNQQGHAETVEQFFMNNVGKL